MKKTLLLLTVLTTLFSSAQVPTSERNALIALYNATNGANWTNNTNWNTTQPVSTWSGITVETVNGGDHVTWIELINNNLQGTIPSDIGNFPYLNVLYLYNNNGISGEIPTEIGNLTNLIALAFSWNYNMTGSIPSTITNLTNLQYLYLNNNKFSGTIPNLTSLPLSTFWIHNNNFDFGDFENEFTSYANNISDFTYYSQNEFYKNNYLEKNIGDNGSITSTVSGANNTYQWYKVNTPNFSQDSNDATLLSGETNATLNFTNIQSTDFGYYYCVVTNSIIPNLEIKSENFKLVQAVPQIEKDALMALYNATDGPNWNNNENWNTSLPVDSWYGVKTNNGHVSGIYLYNNDLTGTLPADIVNLSQIEHVRLSNNNLYGAIPNLTGLSNLTGFTIWNNNFQFGDFENEFNDYLTLTASNNGFFNYSPMNKLETEIVVDIVAGTNYSYNMPTVSGTGVTYQWYKNGEIIPGETGQTLNITNAQLSDAGNYTCKASSPIITDLTIDRNTIHIYDTVLPSDKTALITLYYATDGTNWTNNTNWNTSAPVYQWYGVEMEGNRVTSINLDYNNLIGTLPTQIGDLGALKTLNLSNNNQLTGSIPTEIGNLTALEILNFRSSQINGNLPIEIGNLTDLTSLMLHGNQLTGNIPTQLGNLTNLTHLNLSSNLFTGNIPSELGSLTNISYFDIEDNQLTGNIPSSIENLPNIRQLYLWNNQLEGDLDVSSLTTLASFTSGDNLFTSIDIRTGNNASMNFAYFGSSLPNLTCIFVDDTNYSNTHWYAPTGTHFVETQAQCDDFYTYIPDDNFEQALIDLGLDNILDNKVRTSNINTITSLNVDGKSITDLTGIEDFVGLTELICWNNNITSLDVTNNINLINLFTAGNPIGSLNVSQNTMLEVLYCGYNQLSTLDLSNNSNLKQLGCRNNNLSSLDLTHNPDLFYLVFSNNSLTSININNLNLLQHLVFNNNQISTIDLSNNLALTGFYCENNLLTEINISQNQNIYRFDCSGNALENLNIKNTDYLNFTTFDATDNPNLTCVYVDDKYYMNTNWINAIDATATFVETQAECNALSINDETFKQNLELFPNPTKDIITIVNNENIHISKITVSNTLGQILLNVTTVDKIDISNLPNGLYYVNIGNDKGKIAVFKVMKE